MAKIDLEVSTEIAEAIELPLCEKIELPDVDIPEIKLPTGGSLKAVVDATNGIPSDCSLNLNLLVQVAPMLASMECLLKVLGLIKPLTSIIQELPTPSPGLVDEFNKKVAELTKCLDILTPNTMLTFVYDVLRLIIKILQCVTDQLQSIVELMEGLAIQIELAEAEGNTELIRVISCAQKNAERSAQHTLESIGSVKVILGLLEPFMSIANVDAIQLPAISSDSNLQVLKDTLGKLNFAVCSIEKIIDPSVVCDPLAI